MDGLGAYGQQGRHPAWSVPVMSFFSATDPMAKPPGIPDWLTDIVFRDSIEAASPGPAVPEAWAVDWAVRNGCHRPATIEPLYSGITQQHYTSYEQDAEVVLISTPGMGNAWPGGHHCPSWEHRLRKSMPPAGCEDSSRNIPYRLECEVRVPGPKVAGVIARCGAGTRSAR